MPRQRRRSRRGIQGKLAKQAEKSKLLRILFGNVWLRLAVVGCVLAVLGLGLSILPIIQTSPSGVKPVIKVNMINLVQAWRLRTNAETVSARGDHEGADYYWRAALYKNPGNLPIIRGALENALAAESQDRDWLIMSIAYANRLLLLSQTNDVSLDLVAEFYEKRQLLNFLPGLLEPHRENLSPAQSRMLLQSYFRERKLSKFRLLWEQMSEEARADDVAKLHHWAYVAGWGKVGESLDALDQLDQMASSGSPHALMASRLLLAVYGQNRDIENFEMVLSRIREAGLDEHFHHAAYWMLLFDSRRPNVARHQAEDYWQKLVRNPVTSSTELGVLARAYNHIGLVEKALDLFESLGEDFAATAEYWAAYGSVLVSQEKWDDLRVLALKIRNEAFSSRVIRAYSYYLEGLAEAGQGRTYNAGRAFDDVIGSEAKLSVGQAIEMAWEVYGIGYPEIAARLLTDHRADLERNLRYWEITFASAYKLKRADLILDASKRMMALDKDNVVSINNFAAALLVRREKPEEAIRYTLQLVGMNASNPGFVLNHGLALLQNGRLDEAERYFNALVTEVLRPELVSSLSLGWFEFHYRNGDKTEAEKALLNLNEGHLFPEQLDWLISAKSELGIDLDDPASPEA